MSDAPDQQFIALQEALAGRYSLERELGRGGMGIVYLAHEVALDRPVALKLLPPELAAQPALRERFLREARYAGRSAGRCRLVRVDVNTMTTIGGRSCHHVSRLL